MTEPSEVALDELRRWETAGGHWEVLADDGTRLTVSLLTCDGGEEMARLVSDESALREYVWPRRSSGEVP